MDGTAVILPQIKFYEDMQKENNHLVSVDFARVRANAAILLSGRDDKEAAAPGEKHVEAGLRRFVECMGAIVERLRIESLHNGSHVAYVWFRTYMFPTGWSWFRQDTEAAVMAAALAEATGDGFYACAMEYLCSLIKDSLREPSLCADEATSESRQIRA